MKILNNTLCLMLLSLLIACGVRQEQMPPQSSSNANDNLANGAQQTYFLHIRASRESGEPTKKEISSKHWTAEIKALKPIKVYRHRNNIVVVQRRTDNTEEGIYIYISISSYLPQSGDDGFEFRPNPINGDVYTLGDGVFEFKRTLK